MPDVPTQRLINAEENEKRRIARELHDHAAQLITALSLTVEQFRVKVAEGGPYADAIKRIVSKLARHIGDLSMDLRPPMLDDFGFVPAITALASRLSNQTQMHIELELAEFPRLAPHIETTAFRIVQQALTHASKQDAARASVQVEKRDHELRIAVIAERAVLSDEMRERVLAVGGTLLIGKTDANSTRVAASLPLE